MTDSLDHMRRLNEASEWERRARAAEEQLAVAEANLEKLRHRLKELQGDLASLRVSVIKS